MEGPVVVRRLPVGRAAALPHEGPVVERRDQGVARGIGERGEVDRRFQERADRPGGVERTVEAAVARVAPADQRLDFPRLAVGDHHRALQSGVAEALVAVELGDPPPEHLLRLVLDARVERGENPQTFGAQVGFVIVAPQVPIYEVDESRVGRGAHRGLGVHPEAGRAREHVLLEGDRVRVTHLAQHQVPALERPVRVAVGVEYTRAFHHGDEKRTLGEGEPVDVLAEVVERGEADAVDGAIAVLAEVDLVQVSLEDLLLAVMQLEQHRHDELGAFALERALGGEEEVLDELLRQGAAALQAVAAHEAPRGAGDAAQVVAVVCVEGAVLGGDERLHQGLGDLREADQHPVLVVAGIDAADRQRLEAREREIGAQRVLHFHHAVRGKIRAHPKRALRPVPEAERTHRYLQPVAVAHEPARITLANPLLIAVLPQLVNDVGLRDAKAGVQLERPCVEAGGKGEAPAFELAAHAEIEIQREARPEQSEGEKRVAEITPEFRAAGLDLAEQAAMEHGANCTLTQ